jgi:hypothetical protein
MEGVLDDTGTSPVKNQASDMDDRNSLDVNAKRRLPFEKSPVKDNIETGDQGSQHAAMALDETNIIRTDGVGTKKNETMSRRN